MQLSQEQLVETIRETDYLDDTYEKILAYGIKPNRNIINLLDDWLKEYQIEEFIVFNDPFKVSRDGKKGISWKILWRYGLPRLH